MRDGRGWAFREGRGHEPDPVNGFTLLQDAYLATDPGFAGHISVPALWDRETNRLVSNHYATMTIDLETQFAGWADPGVDLYPAGRRDDIERTDAEIVRTLATGAYAAMAAPDQEAYDAISSRVYDALALVRSTPRSAALPRRRRHHRRRPAPVREPHPLRCGRGAPRRLTRKRLVDHPHLWAYVRDLTARPAFRETTDLDHIVRGTFGTGAGIRSNRIVPDLPDVDWDAPHGRDTLG